MMFVLFMGTSSFSHAGELDFLLKGSVTDCSDALTASYAPIIDQLEKKLADPEYTLGALESNPELVSEIKALYELNSEHARVALGMMNSAIHIYKIPLKDLVQFFRLYRFFASQGKIEAPFKMGLYHAALVLVGALNDFKGKFFFTQMELWGAIERVNQLEKAHQKFIDGGGTYQGMGNATTYRLPDINGGGEIKTPRLLQVGDVIQSSEFSNHLILVTKGIPRHFIYSYDAADDSMFEEMNFLSDSSRSEAYYQVMNAEFVGGGYEDGKTFDHGWKGYRSS